MTRSNLWLTVPAMVLLTHCGAATEHLRVEVKTLRDEVAELKRSQAAERLQFDELRQRLVAMEDRANVERAALARHDEGWIPKLPTVKVEKASEVAPVEAKVVAAPPPAPQVAHVAPTRPVQQVALPHLSLGGGPGDDLAPQTDTPVEFRDPVTTYERAKSLIDGERYDEARPLFEKFLGLWPRHDLADNALYWLGESYRRQSLWTKAASYYLRVRQDYPKANKVPDALWQLGTCYHELGDTSGAQDAWSELSRRYPRESSAKLAMQKLAVLRGKSP